MPNQIFELFGTPLHDQSSEARELRSAAFCPYAQAPCDGGGNRYQTTIHLQKASPELQKHFSKLDQVIPGVCSIQTSKETWLVCPRRLFAVRNNTKRLLPHEQFVLDHLGFSQAHIGIWAEVAVSHKDSSGSFNYHFDYIVSPIAAVSAEAVQALFPKDKALQKQYQNSRLLLPTLEPFAILEVMTASTSGSNKSKGSDIASAFEKAILAKPHTAPAINKRQVWGRMATQLFAKSACAAAWGGETIWLLQDQFLAEIENTTRFSSSTATPQNNTIQMMVFHIDDHTGETVVQSVIRGEAGLPFEGENSTFTGILLPKTIPPREELLKAMLRKPPLLELKTET
jgi:hypothetical protein